MTNALTSGTLTSLLPALVAAQAAFGKAVKDAKNSHFGSSYTTLASALDAMLPALNANGLVLLQQTRLDEATVMLRTTLAHVSGEWIASDYPVLPTKPDPQGYGSALTYARRYAAMALAGVAPEDDDGNLASTSPSVRTHRPPTFVKAHGVRDTGPPVVADALAADLADAIDDASSVARLDELVPSLQELPTDLRAPLRRRFSERRAVLRSESTSTSSGLDPPFGDGGAFLQHG